MTRIYSGANFNSIYDASNAPAQNETVAGLGENKLSEVTEGNCLARPKEHEGPGREGEGCREHRRHHLPRAPFGDPQAAQEIKHLLQELERVLFGRSPRDADKISFGHGRCEPIDADKISFPVNLNKAPIDADKISFRVGED
jgi:hypothetical protein